MKPISLIVVALVVVGCSGPVDDTATVYQGSSHATWSWERSVTGVRYQDRALAGSNEWIEYELDIRCGGTHTLRYTARLTNGTSNWFMEWDVSDQNRFLCTGPYAGQQRTALVKARRNLFGGLRTTALLRQGPLPPTATASVVRLDVAELDWWQVAGPTTLYSETFEWSFID